MMRLAATLIVIVLAVACTGTPSREATTSSVGTSALGHVVPDVVGQNFLEAAFNVRPQFRLLDVRYEISPDVPNGTILSQRPAAGAAFDATDAEVTIRVVVSQSPR
jgi:beta-lactam-binding protein with PASTA domain